MHNILGLVLRTSKYIRFVSMTIQKLECSVMYKYYTSVCQADRHSVVSLLLIKPYAKLNEARLDY